MAMAAIANPTTLSPPTALASQKPVASHFPSSLRPLSSTSSSSSSSAAYALHNLHRIPKPWLPIIPRKLDAPLVRLEAAAVADAEAELAEGEAASDSAVATAPPPSKPKTGKAALPLKRDRTRSKRFLEIQKLRENKKEYDVPAAVSLLKQTSNTKFVASAEAHFRLNIDPKYNDQQLRATVFYKAMVERRRYGERIDEAKNAGADIVGGEELIQQIKGGFMDFDKLIASPDMMPKAIQEFKKGKVEYRVDKTGIVHLPFGKINFSDEDLIVNLVAAVAIQEFKKGKVEYRVDKTGIVHLPFGKINFSDEDLIVNLVAAVRSIEANKPSGAKGVYWKSAHICSSMGPSIRLNIREMLDYKPPVV
ncbi:hypothetical protein C4D60_Mb11t05600 [Musa balbisiana]|uniref:Ribosomal protein n=1 Tax=Musa balbisiana TaxID=52838 RepID=A0A4V4H5B3_MUSBA|nr:hypothetical protein C4D60_Mb11t05600 [Musa balbisiana]